MRKERDDLCARLYTADTCTRVCDTAGDDFDAEHRLLCAFVQDSVGFFEDANADESGDLSLQEFTQACSKNVPDTSQEKMQSVFALFDTDRDSQISMEKFSEQDLNGEVVRDHQDCCSLRAGSQVRRPLSRCS